MLVENPLLMQARSNIRHHADHERELIDAHNLLLQEVWPECVDLLDQGRVKREPSSRVLYGVLALTVIGVPIVGLMDLASMKISRDDRHIWEFDDQKVLKTSLKVDEDEIGVVVTADHHVPLKASSIAVRVSGLPEYLKMHKEFSGIYVGTGSIVRYATLEDAENWDKLVNQLH